VSVFEICIHSIHSGIEEAVKKYTGWSCTLLHADTALRSAANNGTTAIPIMITVTGSCLRLIVILNFHGPSALSHEGRTYVYIVQRCLPSARPPAYKLARLATAVGPRARKSHLSYRRLVRSIEKAGQEEMERANCTFVSKTILFCCQRILP
jgi:hypothetical protein